MSRPAAVPAALSDLWEPRPPRSRAGRWVRFALTVLHFPFHVVLWLVLSALLVAYALVMELVFAILPFLEGPAEKAVDRSLGAVPIRPRWWTTWGELRHEDDPAFHRARLEKRFRKLNGKLRKTVVGAHLYRCAGLRVLFEIAAPYGWTLDEGATVRSHREIRLSRSLPATAQPQPQPPA